MQVASKDLDHGSNFTHIRNTIREHPKMLRVIRLHPKDLYTASWHQLQICTQFTQFSVINMKISLFNEEGSYCVEGEGYSL